MNDSQQNAWQRERERLDRLRAELERERCKIDCALCAIKTEVNALDLYRRVMTGAVRSSDPLASSPGPRQGRWRECVYREIAKSQGGVNRGDIIRALGLGDQRERWMSVSNALSALSRAGRITRSPSDARLYIAR